MPLTDSSIKSGTGLKLLNRNEQQSHVDCIGYAYASELSINFLTGDQKFKGEANVGFVK
jgi:hypothetical protein